MASFLAEKYVYVMDDLGDPRVKDWISVSSPALALTTIFIYLLSIYIFLPAYMENRTPYNLKTFLYFYNIFQIVYCLSLIYGIATSGLTLFCQPVDYSTDKQAMRTLICLYYTYVLKGIEFIETVVFILRKKYNQVSPLHVYHHVSTFVLLWIMVKFVGGGMVAFQIAVNSVVHTLMYSYYFLASLGEEWQKKLEKWKPRLTVCQMVQFAVLIVHSLQLLYPDCHMPTELLVIYLPDVFVVFYMFWEFYRKNYHDEKKD
ncbi:hypothetical protein Zmor_001576 [Zophobas morio]|uniref:Elongation of very long chain fatty acids protein n=1 Tax=Zophobas morio TaxID=2755281 RepID=A0AA38J2V1_9CUCU|nr:hypothetical protein Zmor_001576 [Zophobas morio]